MTADPGIASGAQAPLLQLRNIQKKFGAVPALNGVTLTVQRGEVVCLIGPSGCGKSTLLRCVNFLVEPDDGEMLIKGEHVGRVMHRGKSRRDREGNIRALRVNVGMVFQSFNLWPHLTALENVTCAPIVVRGLKPNEAEADARELLKNVGLADKVDSYPVELSGGQKQRVAIARALAMKPELLLLDEPTSALDPELVGEVLAVMQRLASEGRTMLIATHEMGFARAVANRVIFMDRGQIVEMDTPAQVFDNPRSDRLKAFLSAILRREN